MRWLHNLGLQLYTELAVKRHYNCVWVGCFTRLDPKANIYTNKSIYCILCILTPCIRESYRTNRTLWKNKKTVPISPKILHNKISCYVHAWFYCNTGVEVTTYNETKIEQIGSMMFSFHYSKPEKWFELLHKNLVLTNYQCSGRQWRQPSARVAWMSSRPTASVPHLGGTTPGKWFAAEAPNYGELLHGPLPTILPRWHNP